ncbi:MAG: citramalate synthase [Elusimicrobiota bacterium]
MNVKIYDTTLRDGSQGEGISLSLDDKLKIAKRLDTLGVHYLEGGWPGSNPKDILFFEKVRELDLKKIKIAAFGSTRRKDISASSDANLKALVAAKPDTACIFGKTWDLHVKEALRTTLDENIKMIYDSLKYLKENGLEVVYDAEHFFDGYKANPEYALKTLKSAEDAGADNITLCDTNGGLLPSEVENIFKAVKNVIHTPLGIHTHNDSGMADANSLLAVTNGAVLVHGTINGYGERCGNADLCVLIPNLQLKLKMLDDINIKSLRDASLYVSEIANMVPRDNQPYVGMSAFTHKAGIHVSAMQRNEKTYEHINPSEVGNIRRIIVSELAGKSNILEKAKELNVSFKSDDEIQSILELIKKKEHEGYHYEGADASLELLFKRGAGLYKPMFGLEGFRVTIESDANGNIRSEASLRVTVNGEIEHTAAEGDGPVNALDNALRKALEKFYPVLKDVSLSDFKVRVINAEGGTAAKVRVLIESRDESGEWSTIGVSENIIEASWFALVDSIEYKLLKRK